MNACAMVNKCLRHQMPECYDLPAVAEAEVPTYLRYGQGEHYEVRPSIAEPAMGDPDHVPLGQEVIPTC